MSDRLQTELRREQLLLQQELFFREILSRVEEGKYPRILPKGHSMHPFIRGLKDSIILGKLRPESYQVGRIVLAKIPQGYLVHRIERIDGDLFTLRGDGNPRQREECTRDQIFAEIIEVQRGKQRIHPEDKLWRRYERFWPKSTFVRRWLLAVYRRTFLRWGL